MERKKLKLNGKLYDLLGLQRYCSSKEVKKSYRELILIHHPDKNQSGSHDQFIAIKKAYDILSDREKRLRYNKKLVKGLDGDLTSDDEDYTSLKRKHSDNSDSVRAMRNADFIRKQFENIEEEEECSKSKRKRTVYAEFPENPSSKLSPDKSKSNFQDAYSTFTNLFG